MAEKIVENPLLSKAARLAAHPAFPRAVEAYCAGLARLRQAPRLLNVIVATDVRWRILGYMLYLAADKERFGPQGGATYGRLLALCTRRQEASPRELKTLLGILRASFLVRVERDRLDARIGYYQPTERLDEFVRGWMCYAAEALDLLEPEAERARLIDDPSFLSAFHVSGGRAHLSDKVPLADRVPEPMSALKDMLGSYSVIVGVMEATLARRPLPPPSSMAKRFGLSRSQVMNVLAAGEHAGLFARDVTGQIAATTDLRGSFAHWISIELAFYSRHMAPPGTAAAPIGDTLA